MKKILKSLAVAVLLITTCLGFYAFKKYKEVTTAADIFKSIMYDGIYTASTYDKKAWPDSTMITQRPASWDSTTIQTIGPDSLCNTSPAYFYYNLAQSIVTSDVKYDGYNKQALLKFKQAFGKDLMAPGIKLPGLTYQKKPIFLKQFKADALKAAFDQLYKKPTEDFDGFAMQRIYDIAVRDYFRNCTQVIVDVMKKKAVFVQLALDYKKQATASKSFDGVTASGKAHDKLLGENYAPKQGIEGCMEYGADRIVGMMLRRQIDGSLPTLLICVKTMLKDYDPEFYTTIQSKF